MKKDRLEIMTYIKNQVEAPLNDHIAKVKADLKLPGEPQNVIDF